MAKSVMKDMTTGSPLKLILQFFIPMFFGLLFQQFYNMMDTMIVGKILGVDALAAVGATGSVNFMIIGLCVGICNGFAIPMAQRFGAGDYHGLRKFVANSVWVCLAFMTITTVTVCVLCRQILEWMNTPADIIDGAYSYIFVIFLGIPVIYLYNLAAGIMRSMGDSKNPLFFLIFCSILNIGLDFLLILVFDMGVAGAAWATVISQGVSGVGCLICIKKEFAVLKISRDEWRLDKQCVKILCNMGLPMGLQYSITAIGSVVLQTAVNTLGSLAVAAVTAGGRVSMIFCCPFDALGSTMATYAGQNVGAGKLKRVSQGMKTCCMLGFVYSLIAAVVLVLFGSNISTLFVDVAETAILKDAGLFLTINSLAYFFLVLVNVVRFTIQGLGFSRLAMLAGVAEMAARGIVALGFVPAFGYVAACFANPTAWVFADLFLVPAYCYVMRKLHKILEK